MFISTTSLIRKSVVAAIIHLACSASAHANDSTMLLKAGGIELVSNPWVTMEEETLTIRPERIDVHYVFRNTSDEDRNFLVAFPLPDIVGNDVVEAGIVMADEKSENFLGFTVLADDVKVTPSISLKAYANGLDVTDDLQRNGLPLNPRFAEAKELEALGPDIRRDFAERGIARYFSDTEAYAAWDLRTTFYWRQSFPKGIAVSVDHSYVPVPGLGFFSAETKQYDSWIFKDYCIDGSTEKAALKLLKSQEAGNGAGILHRRIIQYILTTGNNWQSSIGRFKLVIDAGDPRHLISTCFRGVKRLSPSHFEFEAKDFEPTNELGVLFIEIPKDL